MTPDSSFDIDYKVITKISFPVSKSTLFWVYSQNTYIWNSNSIYVIREKNICESLCSGKQCTSQCSVAIQKYFSPKELVDLGLGNNLYKAQSREILSDKFLSNAPEWFCVLHCTYIAAIVIQEAIVLKLLDNSDNLFITGQAGTGKSYILKEFVKRARCEKDLKVAVVAPTGVAALNVHGSTIHSFFRIPIYVKTEQHAWELDADVTAQSNVLRIDTLVIDEISMVSKNMLSILDILCKRYRQNADSFGGIRIVCFGDFLQLPPVDLKNDSWAFNSALWKFKKKVLMFSFRQDHESFVKILGSIRRGEIVDSLLEELLSGSAEYNPNWPHIYGTNRKKNIHNNLKLSELEGPAKSYKKITTGTVPSSTNKIIPNTLVLRIDAKVMVIKNKKINEVQIVNGDLGTVVGFNQYGYPKVYIDRLRSTIDFFKETWTTYNVDGKEIGSIIQVPLVLGWAFTVHKVQGLTFTGINIDMEDFAFAGQAYVALSRCKALNQIHIKNFNKSKLKTDTESKLFYYSGVSENS